MIGPLNLALMLLQQDNHCFHAQLAPSGQLLA
jgi:hypothetical protein